MRNEEFIREKYRAYIELWASSDFKTKSEKDVLYGAILSLGRVLEFSGKKIHRDMEMASGKYSRGPTSN